MHSYPIEDYHIGIICALPKELTAVIAHFDEEHEHFQSQDAQDHNNYALGQIGRHKVVAACLPLRVFGTNSAAAVSKDMLRTFQHLRFGLLVGIGGGIPHIEKGRDIRLGDIVVGTPDSGHSGVVQYDFGKRLRDGQFKGGRDLNRPPNVLLTALSKLQSRHQFDKNSISEILVAVDQKHSFLREERYHYPGDDQDQLYCVKCAGTSQHNTLLDCAYCDNGAIHRPPRPSNDPVIHYGTIASGNTLLKNAQERDRLRDEYDALCVEMEAAGVVDQIPCLVIRGICDYADAQKNDMWQEYAALTAAAFAKQLLGYILPETAKAMAPVLDILKSLKGHEESLERIETNIDDTKLKQLPSVASAEFDAYDQEHQMCHPGTRCEVLHEIMEWARDPMGQRIFWLNGMAGTGKSTISLTIAKQLYNGKSSIISPTLGASFFFKRGERYRNTAKRLFPTIARRLAQWFPAFTPFLVDAISAEPDIYEKALGEQFEKLIYRPTKEISASTDSNGNPLILIVVVDALDECEKPQDVEVLLKLWLRLNQFTSVQLKLFLTGRPDTSVRDGISEIPINFRRDIVLHEVPEGDVKEDITLYLRENLSQIQKRFSRVESFGDGWPSSHDLQALIDLTVPFFISAATACRYIGGNRAYDPKERLQILIKAQSVSHLTLIENLYRNVLAQLAADFIEPSDQDIVYTNFRLIVGSIIILASPLSPRSLARLLQCDLAKVQYCLDTVHAVLRVPHHTDEPVRTLHLSFREFLLGTKSQSEPYGVSESNAHCTMLRGCLDLLSSQDGLTEDMCDIGYPGRPRSDIDPSVIRQRLPTEMQYACQNWVYHAQQCHHRIINDDDIHRFLQRHFIHWLEALSLIGSASIVIGALEDLKVMASTDSKVSAFLEDARRFALANRHIAEITPLQLYSSAIVFSPDNSLVRRICGRAPSWIHRPPKMPQEWGAELQTLEGHTGPVAGVAFSPDGQLLASASWDRTIKLWKTSTGQEIQTLNGHTSNVDTVAFSPNGQLLASASCNETVRVWEVSTGQEVQKLGKHIKHVGTVAFSPNGQLLASGSANGTVGLWNISKAEEVWKLQGSTMSIRAVAFSPDGQLVASGSDDHTVSSWQVHTGQEVWKSQEHGDGIVAVFFSIDSQLLSVSFDGSITLWETSTGQKVRTLKGLFEHTSVAAFSPSRQLLASASDDGMIQLGEICAGQKLQMLEGHTTVVSAVTFSPDGQLLASGSEDDTVRLWDASTRHEAQKLLEHTGSIKGVAFSPDGRLLISQLRSTRVSIWDVSRGKEIERLRGSFHTLDTMAFSPDGQLVAWILSDEIWGPDMIGLWNLSMKKELCTLKGHTNRITAVAFSPDGQLLASASWDHTVRLWEVGTGQEIRRLQGYSRVTAVAFLSNSQLLSSDLDDRKVKLWDMDIGHDIRGITGYTYPIEVIAFSPDGQLLASTQLNGTIRLWETLTRKERLILKGHTDRITVVAFSPGGRLLSSASEDGTVRLWEVSTGQEVQQVKETKVEEITISGGSWDFACHHGGVGQQISRSNMEKISSQRLHGRDRITIKNQWIQYGGRDLLWLPHGYRVDDWHVEAWAVYKSTIAIGLSSGRVYFMTLDESQLSRLSGQNTQGTVTISYESSNNWGDLSR